MDKRNIQKISRGLLLIFWALLLGSFQGYLSLLIWNGLGNPYLQSILPYLGSPILLGVPFCLELIALGGVVLVVFNAGLGESRWLVQTSFLALAIISAVVLPFITFFGELMFSHILRGIFTMVLITVSAQYFRELSLDFNFEVLARNWRWFMFLYWITIFGFVGELTSNKFFLFFYTLRTPLGIWGLALIWILRRELQIMSSVKPPLAETTSSS